MRDADFLSGKFFDFEIPKDKGYLLKYFTTDIQAAFLRYYFVFGAVKNFTDHTGYYCSRRLLFKMQKHLKRLVKAHDEAKRSLTEEGMRIVHLIESGKLPLTRLPKS